MRLILFCLLTLVTVPAWAEWVNMGTNDHLTIYIDPTTIKKNGVFRRVWELQDMKKLDSTTGAMSIRSLEEFDCKELRFRAISLSTHSGAMAGGKTLVTGNMSQSWDFVPPGTAVQSILNAVCRSPK